VAAAVLGTAEGGLFATLSATSQQVPSTASSRSPCQKHPGVASVPIGFAVVANSTRQRLRCQPLAGPEQRRLRRDVPLAQQSLAPRTPDQMPHHFQIWRRREQGQGKHEVHHQPGRQQTSTLLATTQAATTRSTNPGRYTQVSNPNPDNSPTSADTRTTPGKHYEAAYARD
jgi:hypothetical protein